MLWAEMLDLAASYEYKRLLIIFHCFLLMILHTTSHAHASKRWSTKVGQVSLQVESKSKQFCDSEPSQSLFDLVTMTPRRQVGDQRYSHAIKHSYDHESPEGGDLFFESWRIMLVSRPTGMSMHCLRPYNKSPSCCRAFVSLFPLGS